MKGLIKCLIWQVKYIVQAYKEYKGFKGFKKC